MPKSPLNNARTGQKANMDEAKAKPKDATTIGKRRSSARKEGRASYENRRGVIFDAAVRVFHRHGYQGASLSAVANELGVDRATLYYYFSSKEQMFDEVVRTVVETNEALARRISESSMSPGRKMREIIVAFMTSFVENYPLLHIYVREDLAHLTDRRSEWGAHMRKINRSIESIMIGIVEQGFESGAFRRIGTAKTVARGIIGMLNWSHRWLTPDASAGAEDVGKTFAELVMGGIEAPY